MEKLSSSQQRSLTQWGTQFLVGAELCRRGYTVGFTMGNNTPYADLLVGAPQGHKFWVDVKGLSSKNAWNLRPKGDIDHLFYVLVYFPPPAKSQRAHTADKFFVLTQAEANELVRAYRADPRHAKDTGKAPGFGFNAVAHFENRWDKLPR